MFPQTGLRILAIDDEPTVLEVLASCLGSAGHSVETCASPSDALERFVAEAWDLVITDRKMPGMDGIELASAIKRISPSTPVILMTGMAASVRLNGDSPFDALLSKPFTMASLRQILANATESRKNLSDTPVVFN